MSYRKTAAVFSLFLFLASPVSAQGFLDRVAEIGLKTGVPQATLRTDGGGGIDYQTHQDGFLSMIAFGAYAEIRTGTPYLSVQPELLYVPKGARLASAGGGSHTKAELSLNYIEVPLLLKAHLPVGDRFAPAVYAGPYVGFATGTNLDRDSGETIPGASTARIDALRKEHTDYGLALGGSFHLTLFSDTFTFDARYDLGLETLAGDRDEADVRTGVFTIMLEQSF